jgi:hypothetical protein
MPGLVVNRKPIKDALFALAANATLPSAINGVTTWQTKSRRLKLWNQVDDSKKPALFMVQHREGFTTHGVGRLTRRYLDMGFWCYAAVSSDSAIGDDFLDSMEMALEAAFQPDDLSRDELTLGGLAYWCRITREEGMFIRDPGDLDGQAMLVLPVRILLP